MASSAHQCSPLQILTSSVKGFSFKVVVVVIMVVMVVPARGHYCIADTTTLCLYIVLYAKANGENGNLQESKW